MTRTSLCIAFLIIGISVISQASPFSLPTREAEQAEKLLPHGWVIESKIDGDLNGDGAADSVFVLLQSQAQGDRERALVIAIRRDRKLIVVGTNLGLLACYECMGVKGGDGAPTLNISKGVLVISQFGGSREYYSTTHRFRLNKTRGGMELIGLDQSSGDVLTGEEHSTSTNFLTGDRVVSDTPPKENEGAAPTKPTTRRERGIKKNLQLIEDVGGNSGR